MKINCPRCESIKNDINIKPDKDYYSYCPRCNGTFDCSNEKTQITEFPKMNTDWLLSLRFINSFKYPRFVGDKDLGYGSSGFLGYSIDPDLLYQELNKRPHRIRKRDRRKNKLKN